MNPARKKHYPFNCKKQKEETIIRILGSFQIGNVERLPPKGNGANENL